LFKTIPVKKQGKYNLNVHLQDLGNKDSISGSFSFEPSIRVDDPILSIVAT